MSSDYGSGVPIASPMETWEGLKSDPNSILIDVRTIAEWDYVGEPDLSALGKVMYKVEWMEFPEMTRNEYFADEVLAQFGDKDPSVVYFICRSARRSEAAVLTLQAKLAGSGREIQFVNVAEGFEGDHDAHRHRGTINGWKVRGLPWKQP